MDSLNTRQVLLLACRELLLVCIVVAVMQGVQVCMTVVGNRMVFQRQNMQADAGALIGRALRIGQGFNKQKTGIDRTGAGAQPFQMLGTQLVYQLVNHFLQRFNAQCQLGVTRGERFDGDADNLLCGIAYDGQLLFCFIRECQLVANQLLGKLFNIGGIVANALKVADR